MENRHVLSIVFPDPGADKKIAALKVPSGHVYTVERASAVLDSDLAADADSVVNIGLENGGTAGTATTDICSEVGGTAGWTANTPKDMSITDGSGDLAENEYLNVVYNEGGTVAPGRMTVIVEYVDGIGSKAAA
jgi:hypothetical protein